MILETIDKEKECSTYYFNTITIINYFTKFLPHGTSHGTYFISDNVLQYLNLDFVHKVQIYVAFFQIKI